MRYTIQNEKVKVEVESFGAELKSMQEKRTGIDYMWSANPDYYKRTSPNLFPIVGSLKNETYSYQGNDYKMSQHGFARDMEWQANQKGEQEIWFTLEATEETSKIYPFHFKIAIGYQLDGTSLKVIWKVRNADNKKMYFSCGGHPCFTCPIYGEADKSGYGYDFHTDKNILYTGINAEGLMIAKQKELVLENGKVTFTPEFFDGGAYIVSDNQTHKLSLIDPQGRDYLSVTFEDAPLFGLWSAEGKNAPYAAIEPWYGRCDSTDFGGQLEEREWGNELDPGAIFERAYTITIEE